MTYNRPESVRTPFSHYSHSVVVEEPSKTIYCAGQVAGDEQGNILGPDDLKPKASWYLPISKMCFHNPVPVLEMS